MDPDDEFFYIVLFVTLLLTVLISLYFSLDGVVLDG